MTAKAPRPRQRRPGSSDLSEEISGQTATKIGIWTMGTIWKAPAQRYQAGAPKTKFLAVRVRFPMSRKLRIEYPGAMYHVMKRGDQRQDICNRSGSPRACKWAVGPTFPTC